MAIGNIKNGLAVLGNIIKNIHDEKEDILKVDPSLAANGKITKMMSKFIITPNIIIDNDLQYMDKDKMRDLIKTKVILFTSIVSYGIRTMVELQGINPNLVIDKVSTSDTASDATRLMDIYKGFESMDYVGNLLDTEAEILPAIEAHGGGSVTAKTDLQKDVASYVNSYEIQIAFETVKGNRAVFTIPLIIYPNIIYSDSKTLLNSLIEDKSEKNILTRLESYSAGLISLSDLIFATDLVKKYKDKQISNENNFAKYLKKMDKIHSIKDLVHNKNSFNKNFNIYILDEDKIHTINKLIRGNVLRDSDKDKMTDMLMAFSVAFVDTEEEEVTMLIDSVPNFSVLSFNMLKKEKDSNVNDVLKSLLNNKQPF